MADSQTPVSQAGGGLVKQFFDRYGAYAFGVASLLIIWFSIVSPELRANRADTSKINAIAESQQQMAGTLQQTAHTLQQTAGVLSEATRRLENVTTRLESMRP